MKHKLIFATGNQGKLSEMKRLFGEEFEILGLADIGCYDDIEETGSTLQANAEIKAYHIFDHYRYECFSDDSGLFVEALDGAPGVYTARYAGKGAKPEDHMNKLLKDMEGQTNRRASFKSCVFYVDKEGYSTSIFGELHGTITTEPRGTNGFGYDPIFIPDGYNKTLAEFTDEEKEGFGCRFEAVNRLKELYLHEHATKENNLY